MVHVKGCPDLVQSLACERLRLSPEIITTGFQRVLFVDWLGI